MRKTYKKPYLKEAVLRTMPIIADSDQPKSINYAGEDTGHGVTEAKHQSGVWDLDNNN